MICPSCDAEAGDYKFCPSCGATVVRAAEADGYVGRMIAGKYRVEAMIGEGGMGKVYRARQIALEKLVVLKVLHQSLLSDPRTVARFHREAKAASRLSHANSIQMLDFGQAPDGALYIAMEFVPGKDLHHVLSKEWPLSEARIVRIMAQVLSALADAHAAGVVHRDLKPENIMVEQRRGEPDFVKVLDFGIAKIQDASGEEGPALTRAGFVCGTPEYMSPEQARGKSVDHRSDLYAVGVILYQLSTGMLPFDSDTAVGFATKHLTEIPPPPSVRRPEAKVSPAMEALILRALEKDPAARPQSAEEFRAELLSLDKDRRAANVNGDARPVPVPPVPQKATPLGAAAATTGQGRVVKLGQDPGTSVTSETTATTGGGSSKVLKLATGGLVAAALALGGVYVLQSGGETPAVSANVATVAASPVSAPPSGPAYERQIAADQRDAAEARRLAREGDEAHIRGDLIAAADRYQQAFLKDPTPELSLKLGEVHFHAQRVQEARGWWARHLKDAQASKAKRYILEAMPDLATVAP